MSLDPALLKQLTTLVTIFSAAFLAALWLSLIYWVFRDIRARSRDRFFRILAVVIVTLLFLPGLLVYLIIRPARTIEEEYQLSLEEEALLQTLEDNPLCPGCNRRIKNDWLACPNCHSILRKNCRQCGRIMELSWSLCPYCSTPVEGMHKEEPAPKGDLETFLDDDLLSRK